jgi:hypothetical protein
MKTKILPYFLLFCAIGLSATAAYYSVIGLSMLFAGVAIPVIIMGSFLEVSKIAIATYLHNQWKKILLGLKIYLTIALIILSFITSLGIYGLLTTGFQSNISKMEINQKEINNIQIKRERFEQTKQELTTEKQTLEIDISNLRNALSTNTTTQYVDRETGQLITRANTANRKSFENQLSTAISSRDTISSKIEILNDSLLSLDMQILNMESDFEEGNELGVIKYVSEITNKPIKQIANFFILLIIFVFDPLAIMLVIATNSAFHNIRKPTKTNHQPTEPAKTTLTTNPNQDPSRVEEMIKNLENEKNQVASSNMSFLAKGKTIQEIQDQIDRIKKSNNI